MTASQLLELEPALNRFAAFFSECFQSDQSASHFSTYLRGLLSDLPRKSIEPIALFAGTPPRTLQQFLKHHAWDAAVNRDRLHERIALSLDAISDDLGTVALLDETSVVKKGIKTPGVQRQYLGCIGKIENGIVTVHLGVSRGSFKCLIDSDLFLPQSWSNDRPRCREAGIPDELVHRTKCQMALDQLDRAALNDLKFDWLTFDEGYGMSPGFLMALTARKQKFVAEVPRTFRCLAMRRDGRRPEGRISTRTAETVVRGSSVFLSQEWQVLRLKRKAMEDQVWRVKAARVWLRNGERVATDGYWLIWACNDGTGEEKFFVSNGKSEEKVEHLMRVAFRRAEVEHAFRICKQELGFGHFEGQNYEAMMRHQMICLSAMAFAAETTQRLRGEKPIGDG
ncbi:MAG: IS701 family transposase [Planctomycetaceae bacterium]|nr:IS701 family transposase [Planctomycetaceae bacterium]